MQSSLTFMSLYLAAMFLPGALLANVLRLRTNWAGVSISLSICLLIFAIVASRMVGLGVTGFLWLLSLSYAALLLANVILYRGISLSGILPDSIDKVVLVPLLTFVSLIAYCVWAGPYTEVPSDAWHHIGEIQDRFERATSGRIGHFDHIREAFDKYSGYSYTVTGVVLALAELPPALALSHISIANTLLFCIGVYSFSLYIFGAMGITRHTRHWMAAASVFFFVAQFGLAVFSYARYYAFSPAILNYVVYLSALACTMVFIERNNGRYRYLMVAGGLAVAAAMLHVQETVFIVIMGGTVIFVECLRRSVLSAEDGGEEETGNTRVWVLSGLLILAFVVVYGWALVNLSPNKTPGTRTLTDIGNVVPFLRDMPILKPGFQFYQVVTVWGTLVYLLFLFRLREFKRSSFLLAGMAIPVLTVFNPVFTDFFLRFSWPELLWRMCFMLPLPFVGAYLLVSSIRSVSVDHGIGRRAMALSIALLLLALLLPFQSTYFVSPYSKIYTVKPVDDRNSQVIWGDVLAFLYDRNSTEVITDPVSGYVVRALTEHEVDGHKFYSARNQWVSRKEFEADDFNDKDGWLIVVNHRDGRRERDGVWPGGIGRERQ